MANARSLSVLIASILSFTSQVTANTHSDARKDSVESWGVWAQNYTTAAGGEFKSGQLPFSDLSLKDSGRSSLNEPTYQSSFIEYNVPVFTCEAGSFCAYGLQRRGIDEVEYEDRYSGILRIADKEGALSFNEAFKGRVSDSNLLDGVSIIYSVEGNDGFLANQEHVDYFQTHDFSRGAKYITYVELGSKGVGINFINHLEPLVLARWWQVETGTEYSTTGYFFGGMTTSLEQLNAFTSNLNGPIARYTPLRSSEPNYEININFSSKSWSGSFDASHNGNDSFDVTNGTLSGISLTAKGSQLSAVDGVVDGAVNGALFGENAEALAGVIDIKKAIGSEVIERQATFTGIREEPALPR